MDEILSNIVSEDFARDNIVYPYSIDLENLYVYMQEYDIGIVDSLMSISKRSIRVSIKSMDYIMDRIENGYRSSKKIPEEDASHRDEMRYNSIVENIIKRCINENSSDIHIEPSESDIRVRCRIDGDLKEIDRFPKDDLGGILSVVKLRSGMNITEKRLPQDGRFSFGNGFDIRVSTIPTISGEKIEMRILNRQDVDRNIDLLGFDLNTADIIKKMANKKSGMILISGSTNSGKSTTMYSIINYLNDNVKNITTIEDPVEYKIDGINQMQVNTKVGLEFKNGLKSILRQDPDVIVLGEMRDEESARLAIRAAITGHLVISTVHTRNAVEVVTRLMDMGIEKYLISSSLLGIISQKLIKKSLLYQNKKLRGRELLYEVINVDEEIRTAIRASDNNSISRNLRRILDKKSFLDFEMLAIKKLSKYKDGKA